MPITHEGSWITLWLGTVAGYTMHIPHGMVLLLQPNVVHRGGTPKVDIKYGEENLPLSPFLPSNG
jgi:hypothetical protein